VPARVLFIDLWPDALAPGEVRDRFRDLPGCAREHGCELAFEHFTRVDAGSLSARAPAAVMLSGSRTNLVDDPADDPRDGAPLAAFAAVTDLLARLPATPVLGICFGHQYLAKAAGGRLELMPAPRDDNDFVVTPREADPLLVGLPPRPAFVESHKWRVAEPGRGYRVVATSSDGVEMVRHESLPRVGVQFHPEYFGRQKTAPAPGRGFLANWFDALAARR
jgi:GMP synthase-like glutamine amidotransferase